MNLHKVACMLLFMCYTNFCWSQTIDVNDLIGNWELTVYELKGKDQQMILLFDNSNVDSSFNLLVDKLAKEETDQEFEISEDSLNTLKKDYQKQVKYLSKSYFKFSDDGKCKYNLINDKAKFKLQTDTYSLKDDILLFGDGAQYKIVGLTSNRMVIHSNNGKMQMTYTKQ
jgi:hypothetical protein